MARGKRRGGKRGTGIGKWVNRGFKILGTVVAAGPAIKGVGDHLSDPGAIPTAVLYNYSGIDVGNPSGGVNFNQLTVGVASVLGGIALGKVGGFLGRMMR